MLDNAVLFSLSANQDLAEKVAKMNHQEIPFRGNDRRTGRYR